MRESTTLSFNVIDDTGAIDSLLSKALTERDKALIKETVKIAFEEYHKLNVSPQPYSNVIE